MNSDTPSRILVMQATVTQFLHDFDGAEATLKIVLAKDPVNAQAWLTVATIDRVRGRYDSSDAACRELDRIGRSLYASACLAENAGLRGNGPAALATLQGLLDNPVLQTSQQAATRQWLLTTIAEVQELSGHAALADAAYRRALEAQREGYDVIAYSDFLLAQSRPAEALALLGPEPRSDAVLLRLAIAGRRLGGQRKATPAQLAATQTDVDELGQRFESAGQRPGATALHAREHALFALDVRDDPRAALELARLDLTLQREPIDYLLMARAAVATHDEQAQRELRMLMRETGFHDARIDALF
jgi:hypothetical protein